MDIMKRDLEILVMFLLLVVPAVSYGKTSAEDDYAHLRDMIVKKYSKSVPKIFSQNTPGVKKSIATKEKIIAITLDACGGKKGSGFDRELITFLRENKIPATLFVTGLWIDANPALFKELAADPLFEIENHGLNHKPASVKGARIYRRRGTGDPGELADEVELNAEKIEKLTGRRPVFYRAGTAYYDDVAVRIVYDLKQIPMNFSIVSGDAAGYTPSRIERRITGRARKGSVIIAHMNRPGKNLFPAMKNSIIRLKKEGYRFVRLQDYKDVLE